MTDGILVHTTTGPRGKWANPRDAQHLLFFPILAMHLTNVKGSISRLEKYCRCSLSLLDFQRWQVYFWEKEKKKGEDRLKKRVRVFLWSFLWLLLFYVFQAAIYS